MKINSNFYLKRAINNSIRKNNNHFDINMKIENLNLEYFIERCRIEEELVLITNKFLEEKGQLYKLKDILCQL